MELETKTGERKPTALSELWLPLALVLSSIGFWVGWAVLLVHAVG